MFVIRIFSILLISLFMNFYSSIMAHHTGASGDTPLQNNNRFINPFTGNREKPNNYIVTTYELQKGERENRNLHTMTVFGETIFKNGMFALNASVPYIYYEQKGRPDAARYGKIFVGAKYLPFFDLQKNYILILESRFGFASGKNSDRFAGGNYNIGVLNLSFGYSFSKVSLMSRVSGQFPLGSQKETNSLEYNALPYFIRPGPNYFEDYLAQDIQLKKVSTFSFYINYFVLSKLSLFAGFLYRTPYEGIEKTRVLGNRIPKIFRELSLGISYNISEKYFINFSYRYPLNRGQEFRLYESAYSISFLMEF